MDFFFSVEEFFGFFFFEEFLGYFFLEEFLGYFFEEFLGFFFWKNFLDFCFFFRRILGYFFFCPEEFLERISVIKTENCIFFFLQQFLWKITVKRKCVECSWCSPVYYLSDLSVPSSPRQTPLATSMSGITDPKNRKLSPSLCHTL